MAYLHYITSLLKTHTLHCNISASMSTCKLGIKYVNLIEIGPVVIESRGVENSELAVPVNNILVGHAAFLAADTQPCVLIVDQVYLNDADKNGHFTVLTRSHAIGHMIQCLKYGVITVQM